MKKLILLLVFSVVAFAQHGRTVAPAAPRSVAPSATHEHVVIQHPAVRAVVPGHREGWREGWGRFGYPRPYYPFRPYPYYYGYNWGFGFGWYDPYFWGTDSTPVVVEDQPCVKKTLKDSQGIKHDVLACRQEDGSYKVVSGQ